MPSDIYTDELKQILTNLRRVLNNSNRFTITACAFQSDFDIDFDRATKLTSIAADQLADYNRRELLPALAELGKYLVDNQIVNQQTVLVDLVSMRVTEVAHADIAQEWYESVYGSYKVY